MKKIEEELDKLRTKSLEQFDRDFKECILPMVRKKVIELFTKYPKLKMIYIANGTATTNFSEIVQESHADLVEFLNFVGDLNTEYLGYCIDGVDWGYSVGGLHREDFVKDKKRRK